MNNGFTTPEGESEKVKRMAPEDPRSPSASYRVAISIPVVLLAFAGAIWGGATVDVLDQDLFSFGAIVITALVIMRSASLYPSAAALPVCVLLMLESNILATQSIARELHYVPELGTVLWRVAGVHSIRHSRGARGSASWVQRHTR